MQSANEYLVKQRLCESRNIEEEPSSLEDSTTIQKEIRRLQKMIDDYRLHHDTGVIPIDSFLNQIPFKGAQSIKLDKGHVPHYRGTQQIINCSVSQECNTCTELTYNTPKKQVSIVYGNENCTSTAFNRINELYSYIVGKDRQLSELQWALHSKQQMINHLQKSITGLQTMLIRAGSKTSNGNATRQMEVELARLQEENWRLNQKIQDQQRRIMILEQTNGSLSKELESAIAYKNQLGELKKKVRSYDQKDNYKDLFEKVVNLSAQLEQLKKTKQKQTIACQTFQDNCQQDKLESEKTKKKDMNRCKLCDVECSSSLTLHSIRQQRNSLNPRNGVQDLNSSAQVHRLENKIRQLEQNNKRLKSQLK